MKIKIKKEELMSAIKALKSSRFNNSVLEKASGKVLLAADDTLELRTAGTYSHTRIYKPAAIEKKGEVITSLDEFSTALPLLPEGEILLEEKNGRLMVKSGRVKMFLPVYEDFPAFQLPTDVVRLSLDLPTSVFGQMIKMVAHASTNDKLDNVTASIHFVVTEDELRLQACDSLQIAEVRRKASVSTNGRDFSIHKIMLMDLQPVLPDDLEKNIRITVFKNNFVMEFDGITIIGVLFHKEFFKLGSVFAMLQQPPQAHVVVEKQTLVPTVKRAVVAMANSPAPCILDIQNFMRVTINGRIGVDEELICQEIHGESLKIGCNPKFLENILKVYLDEEIQIYMYGSKSPVFIKTEHEIFAFMPKKIS